MTFASVDGVDGQAVAPPFARRAEGTFDPLLRVEGLRVTYRGRSGPLVAVDDLAFGLARGESLAILGESGSGKTSLGLALLGLNHGRATTVTGSVRFEDEEILGRRREDLEDLRGARIAMIFQDPMSSLDPLKRIGDQVAEMFIRHRRMGRRDAREAAIRAMERARIPEPRQRASEYPHQLSGGLRQRAMIAMAIALEPALLIADEPTTALDVTVQAQIVRLIDQVRSEAGMALILITHDLGLAAALTERVLVMYAGRVAEQGRLRDLFEHAAHPYTRGLIASAPRGSQPGASLPVIPGMPPRLEELPSGCAFAPRCPLVIDRCRVVQPGLVTVGDAHVAACHVTAPESPA